MRSLHAVLVERATPRLLELIAAALDGTGPAILPLDAGLPAGRMAELLAAFAPDTIEDAGGITTARSGQKEGVAEGTAGAGGAARATPAPQWVGVDAAWRVRPRRRLRGDEGARPAAGPRARGAGWCGRERPGQRGAGGAAGYARGAGWGGGAGGGGWRGGAGGAGGWGGGGPPPGGGGRGGVGGGPPPRAAERGVVP